MEEITKKINDLSTDSQKMKTFNDRRFTDLEMKHSNNHDMLGRRLASLEDKIDKSFIASKRPGFAESNNLYKSALDKYLRKGQESDELHNFQKKEGFTSSEHGYLMTSTNMRESGQNIADLSLMKQLCSVTEVSSEALEVLKDNSKHFVGWSAERKGNYEETDMRLVKKIIPLHEMYAQPRVTQRILDDPRVDAEAFISKNIMEVFARLENQAFISGDGKGKPRGILNYPSYGEEYIERINTGNRDGITADGIIKLVNSLSTRYLANASIVVSHSAIPTIRMLKDSSGRYLWEPRLDEKSPNKLLGIPVYATADMSPVERNKEPMMIGDFKTAYQIVEKFGVRVLRDPFTNKPYIKFYSTQKIGGDVVETNAIKILKVSS